MTDRMIAALVTLFTRPGAWRDAQAAAFVGRAVPLVQGAQRSLAALTAVHIADQAGAALRRRLAPPGIPDTAAVNLRRGVDARTVYHRPFVTVRTALSKGEPLDRAVQIGSSRLREIAELDMQQTYAHASRAAMTGLPAGTQPHFWRRVLVGSENCAMCVVASTQRYHRDKLNPIHPGCDCNVEPIFGTDPGQVIDPDLLEKVHAAVHALTGEHDAGARSPDYRLLTVQMTAEHGELGELLVRPNDRFTGPGDF
jgi:hypothetical protein